LQPDSLIPDPANPQAWNRYSYVGNRPINATDPSGHKCVGEPDECLKDDGTKGSGFTGTGNTGGNNGTGGKPPKKDTGGNNGTGNGNIQNKDSAGGCTTLVCVVDAAWRNPEYLSSMSHKFDAVSFYLDVVGEGMSVGGFLVAGPVGYEAGNLLAQTTTNWASNRVSFISTAFTIRADYLHRATTTQKGNDTLPLGEKSIESMLTTGIGVFPDTTIDLLASGFQFFIFDKPH
jgi:hypothetical protein